MAIGYGYIGRLPRISRAKPKKEEKTTFAARLNSPIVDVGLASYGAAVEGFYRAIGNIETTLNVLFRPVGEERSSGLLSRLFGESAFELNDDGFEQTSFRIEHYPQQEKNARAPSVTYTQAPLSALNLVDEGRARATGDFGPRKSLSLYDMCLAMGMIKPENSVQPSQKEGLDAADAFVAPEPPIFSYTVPASIEMGLTNNGTLGGTSDLARVDRILSDYNGVKGPRKQKRTIAKELGLTVEEVEAELRKARELYIAAKSGDREKYKRGFDAGSVANEDKEWLFKEYQKNDRSGRRLAMDYEQRTGMRISTSSMYKLLHQYADETGQDLNYRTPAIQPHPKLLLVKAA